MKLDVKSFGIAMAIFWGAGLFVITWWFMARGFGGEETIIGMIYPWYEITPMGSLLGMAYGAVDGFIGGVVFAWLYNFIAVRGKKMAG